MAVPTVPVTATVGLQDGSPVEGAKVYFKLDRVETYQGVVAPREVEGVTDATGMCVVSVFPNELGGNGSHYSVKVVLPGTAGGKTFKYEAVVFNRACTLEECITAPVFSPSTAIEAAAFMASDAKVAAQASQAASLVSENNALGSATSAAASAETASNEATVAVSAATTSLRVWNDGRVYWPDGFVLPLTSDITIDTSGLVTEQVNYFYLTKAGAVEKSTTGASPAVRGLRTKVGATDRLLMGMARPDVSTLYQDTAKARCVLSFFNRKRKTAFAQQTTASLASSAVILPTWMKLSTAELEVIMLAWEKIDILPTLTQNMSVNGTSFVGVALNQSGSTSTNWPVIAKCISGTAELIGAGFADTQDITEGLQTLSVVGTAGAAGSSNGTTVSSATFGYTIIKVNTEG